MGRVHQMVVENFKSYDGRIEVGPFRHFTCVIGPNGSGKSNLMDAISFVLGVQAKKLRSGNLRELIHRKEGEDPKKNMRSAFVELTYVEDPTTEEQTAPGTDATMGQVLVFRRSILKGGEIRFSVNGENVSQVDYHKRLESINILSKVRNFLVFQGDVEAVASRQGTDLTAFFEQISGSDQFKEEYDRLSVDKSKAEDNARYLFTKKRNALNEKKRVTHQKDEAEEFRKMEATRNELQQECYLFRLHGIARQLDDVDQCKQGSLNERATIQASIQAQQGLTDAAERERAQAHLAAQQAERAMLSIRSKLDRLNPERVTTRSRLVFLNQRIQEFQQNKDKDCSKRERVESQIAMLNEERVRLESEDKELTEAAQARDTRFTPGQQVQFDKVRADTERLAAASGESVRQLEQRIRAVAAERAQVETDEKESSARLEFLRGRMAELRQSEDSARKAQSADSALAHRRAQELKRTRDAAAARAEELEQLQQERHELMDTVQDLKATERQMKREREVAQTCASISAAISGVHGRVFDLCRPAQKRLNVAVNVSLGKFLDAVIVDSSETARKCVRYLKERMLPPMTFLPLSDLRLPQQDPRLEEMVNNERSARLALNCVNFDERYARAFEFILGGVVFADTMVDGRRIAFGEAREHGIGVKVVTLAGEAIAKNGNLSVNSEATKEGATRFDLSEVDASRTRVETIDRRLTQLHREESASSSDAAALQEDARRLEGRASEAGARLQACLEQVATKQAEAEKAETEVKQLAPSVASLAAEEARLRDEQRALEKKVGDAVKVHFTGLSKQMGVGDVQELEREWRREKEAAEVRMNALGRQLRNVRAELSMLQQTLQERAPRALEEMLPKLQVESEEARQREVQLDAEYEKLASDLRGVEGQVRDCTDAEKVKEKALSSLRQDGRERRQGMMAIDKRLNDMDAEQRKHSEARCDILRHSVLEDIEIPLLRGGQEALQDLVEEPTQAGVSAGPGPAGGPGAGVEVDFSTLPPEKRAASVGPAAKMLEEEYKGELDRLRVEMQRLSPNLKAIEQIQGIAEGVANASRDADVARREIEDMDKKFESVRTQRKEKFMDCFQKVAAEISNTYRQLTSNTAGLHAEGGSAYLDLEDVEDPFNGGIKFTAMPPAKRFRDMHLLSGGEKTLAAMALLFAVHAYQRPPFMVLDEVDAALDANNVRALAGYVEQSECQTIVISLKERFFIRGEALIGVWKDKPRETSSLLTLDLTKYLPGTVN